MELLTRFKHDNNHLVNTLYLYFIGNPSAYILYRLPAVLAGIGSLILAGFIARRDWSRLELFVCLLLAGTSFPLILYFSEARGYAPAIFCALTAYAILTGNPASMKLHRLLLFWLASILGLLAHASFAMVSMALVVFQVHFAVTSSRPRIAKLNACLAHQLPPLVFGLGWYLFYIRNMVIGGGPIYEKPDVIIRAASLALGFPDTPPYGLAAMLTFLAVICTGTIGLYRDNNRQWIFFPAVLLAAPALALLVRQPTYLYFRYFIVVLPFFYLLLAYTLARCYRACPKPYRLLLGLAVCAMLAGQAARIQPLLVLGRGNYTTALKYLVQHNPGGNIRLGSDHDFRTALLLEFYAPRVMEDKTLRYIARSGWKREAPDWFLTHSQQRRYHPPLRLRLQNAGSYRLAAQFRFSGTSGWHWFLYRREFPKSKSGSG